MIQTFETQYPRTRSRSSIKRPTLVMSWATATPSTTE
jgi:hypothetical protein